MAYWLRDRGFEAYAVRGGVAALLDGAKAAAAPGAEPRESAGGALAALRHERFRRYSAGVLL